MQRRASSGKCVASFAWLSVRKPTRSRSRPCSSVSEACDGLDDCRAASPCATTRLRSARPRTRPAARRGAGCGRPRRTRARATASKWSVTLSSGCTGGVGVGAHLDVRAARPRPSGRGPSRRARGSARRRGSRRPRSGGPRRRCSGRRPSLTSLRASISCSSSGALSTAVESGTSTSSPRKRQPPSTDSSAPSIRFIGGAPRNVATKTFAGRLVDVLRRPDLLQHALAHHGDPVPHRHRLDLVVGDVHRRDPEPRVQLDQLEARLDAELRVEVRERLVHQERVRLADDRARERDALPLPARELARIALQQLARARGSRRRGGRRRRSRPCAAWRSGAGRRCS